MVQPKKHSRPDILAGITVRYKTACGNMYVQMNWHQGRLFEVFATLGHSGGCAACQSEALTRSVTLGLRYGLPYEEYYKELRGIQCPTPIPFPKAKAVMSCPDAIGKALTEYGRMSIDELVKVFREVNGFASPAAPAEPVDEEDERRQAVAEMERQKKERTRLGLR